MYTHSRGEENGKTTDGPIMNYVMLLGMRYKDSLDDDGMLDPLRPPRPPSFYLTSNGVWCKVR